MKHKKSFAVWSIMMLCGTNGIKSRLFTLFIGFLIVLMINSCGKNDGSELNAGVLQTEQLNPETNISGSNIIFQSTFESPEDLNQWYMESPAPTSITRVTSPVKYGNNSSRFILKKTDPDIWDSKRAELTYIAEKNRPVKSERWYGLSMFLPSSYIADPCSEIVFQWHGVSSTSLDGYSMNNPPLAMLTVNGRWKLNIKYAAIMNSVDLGTYNKDQWTDWVMRIKWSYESDGLLQIWKNGILILDRKGPNTYKDRTGNYFKMGLYKFGWKEGYITNTTQRIVYYDEVKVGNENSSFSEVVPRRK